MINYFIVSVSILMCVRAYVAEFFIFTYFTLYFHIFSLLKIYQRFTLISYFVYNYYNHILHDNFIFSIDCFHLIVEYFIISISLIFYFIGDDLHLHDYFKNFIYL